VETSVIALSGQTVQRQRQRVGSPSPGLSVPLLSGQTVQPCSPAALKASTYSFQSPCYRVRQCNWNQVGYQVRNQILSVPLLSGQTVQRHNTWHGDGVLELSVPLLSGQTVQPWKSGAWLAWQRRFFQSPCYRVRQCNQIQAHICLRSYSLSVPLLSGQTVQQYAKKYMELHGLAFSPLVIGSDSATAQLVPYGLLTINPFSPLVIGSDSATDREKSTKPLVLLALAATK
jgi:hypothetical protein